MTTTTEIDKKKMVREVIDIIHQCEEDGMESCTNMEVCLYLRDEYGYWDRGEAQDILTAAYLIDELDLMN